MSDEIPALSAWIANWILESPRHAWLRHRLGGNLQDPDTPARETGRIIHYFLRDLASDKVRVYEGQDWRTKEARGFRDRARQQGVIPVLRERAQELRNCAKILRETIGRYGYDLTAGTYEERVEWLEEDSDGKDVLCRGYFDWLSEDRSLILDFKTTTGSLHPDILSAKIESQGAAVQEVAYRRALEFNAPQLEGRSHMIFLFLQLVEPYSVVPVLCGSSMRELGESRWRRAVDVWSRCLRAGWDRECWPPYVPEGADPITVEAPKWALAREIEEEW